MQRCGPPEYTLLRRTVLLNSFRREWLSEGASKAPTLELGVRRNCKSRRMSGLGRHAITPSCQMFSKVSLSVSLLIAILGRWMRRKGAAES